MRPDDFDRVESLFADLLEIESSGREARLDALCANRPDLRAEVEALLAAHDRIGPETDASSPPDPVGPGSELGAFRLLEKIGEGGMGAVFRAERADGAFVQEVAVKMMRAGIAGADRERFKVERQILASLRHPHIVSLIDGGTTPDGRAYLVMELVDGTDIVSYCRERSLPLKERIQLFRTLCAAVQYAHQRGVVHRDLKPANVLIGSGGVLKVLDFGVAKLLLDSPDGNATRAGLAGPVTPNYASPEQLRGLPVTTAADVYALGVMLYELVTGIRPYDTRGLTLDGVLDMVVHQKPSRPSAAAPRARLPGDVDAIVMKAISKDASQRYDSAGELGGDVARFLAGEPVLARGPSAAYVLRRLAARNKTVVSVTALALLAVLATSAVALWQRQVARREQALAERRFRDVRQLANTLIFKVHDAVAPLAGSTPVRRTIVEDALAYLEKLEREAGANDVTLRLELAAAYRQIAGILGDPQRANLGDRDGALRQYERARAIVLPLATGSGQYDAVNALNRINGPLSTLYALRNDQAQAAAIAREAVDVAAAYRQRQPNDLRGLRTLAAASFQLAWSAPRSEHVERWKQALEHYEQLLAREPDSTEHRRNVALVEKYLGSALPPDQAAPHMKRAVDLDQARLDAAPDQRQTQLDTAISIAGLARVLEHQGDLDETARLLERSADIRRRVAESDTADVQAAGLLGSVLTDAARVHRKRGAAADARRRGEEAIGILEPLLKATNDRSAHRRLAEAWLEVGRVERLAGNAPASCRATLRAAELYALRGMSDVDPDLSRETAIAAAACR
jgi:eukaryotic-like serine/threonine-protein kinase